MITTIIFCCFVPIVKFEPSAPFNSLPNRYRCNELLYHNVMKVIIILFYLSVIFVLSIFSALDKLADSTNLLLFPPRGRDPGADGVSLSKLLSESER
jgi:hypothetical protein